MNLLNKNILFLSLIIFLINGCSSVVLESKRNMKSTENNNIKVKIEQQRDIINIKCEKEKIRKNYSETKEIFIRKIPLILKDPLFPFAAGALTWIITLFLPSAENGNDITEYSAKTANVVGLSVFAGLLFSPYPLKSDKDLKKLYSNNKLPEDIEVKEKTVNVKFIDSETFREPLKNTKITLSVPEELSKYFTEIKQTQATDSLGMTKFNLYYDKNKISFEETDIYNSVKTFSLKIFVNDYEKNIDLEPVYVKKDY
ncbi:MAG: hypothetical protein CSB55_03910 [Candidatus Cloacimonadota bacterium]|nr:MAG: hypothetical protein CSB55_03910 [Candidatus Cloacimonadota bacterium]